MKNSIWIWVHHRDGTIDDITFGLVQEAIQLAACMENTLSIVAVAVGNNLNDQLSLLGAYGVDRVIHFKGSLTSRYHGEYYAKILSEYMGKNGPLFFLMAHDANTADLGPRLAAALQARLVTRAVDLRINDQGLPIAVRPTSNGHLFEELTYNCSTPLIATLLPNVLASPGPEEKKNIIVDQIDLSENEKEHLRTKIVNVIEAAPENLDISEADIILAAGRGVGKGGGWILFMSWQAFWELRLLEPDL